MKTQSLKGKRYGDLVVVRTYKVLRRSWVRARCVRVLPDGEQCGKLRHVEARRLRQANACEECSGKVWRTGQVVRNETLYLNGQEVVTQSNYKERFWTLGIEYRIEVLRMIYKRQLDSDNEWEAVEAVVQMLEPARRCA